ncbi:Nuclear cap-binding protein subunit 1 [Smittium mucronatum]|uniref:Nuclear cap-binding protein subunit 1 n=1 Tax=Smittium mucronatum TaxID=133383 RepID=A0A1R0GVB6_9FUNG|nr:Nuclear cap-binding protein subunit 1 [Smittium mucronatum]OLY80819.1 Nuclear cap-binding protein subunit 1 [Smittium mucronatum]
MDYNPRFAGRLRGAGVREDVDEFGRTPRQNDRSKPYSRNQRPYNNGNDQNRRGGRGGGFRYNQNNRNNSKSEAELKLEKITTSIVKFGDEINSSTDFHAISDSLISEYSNDNAAVSAEILKYLIYSVKELVYKHKVYITLFGLLAQKNPEIGSALLSQLFIELQTAVDHLDWRLIRILLRFIGGLVKTRIYTSNSFVSLLNSFLEPVFSNSTICLKSSCLVWLIGCTLCFTGECLVDDPELESILQGIDQYCLRFSEDPVLDRVSNPIRNVQSSSLELMRIALTKLYDSNFQSDLFIDTISPYLSDFDSVEPYDMPSLDFSVFNLSSDSPIKGSKAGKRFGFYIPCGYLEFLFDDTQYDNLSVEKFLLYEMISDSMAIFNVNRKAASSLLHTIGCLNKNIISLHQFRFKQEPLDDSFDDQSISISGDHKLSLEKMIVTVLFSQLFDMPFSPIPAVYYSSLAVELRKQNEEIYKDIIEESLNKMFERSLDSECSDRLADFHSFYVSNYDYRYDYLESSNKQILKVSISKQIRLSYYDYIKAIVIDKMPDLISDKKPALKFKYVISEIDEKTKAVSIAVGKCMKANGTAEMVLNILKEHYGEVGNEYLKLEMLIEHMLFSGSKSFSHLLGSIEKYQSAVKAICSQITDGNQRQFISDVISRFWAGNPQFLEISLDKYMNYQLIDPQSVINTVISDKHGFLLFDRWDIIIDLVNKLELRVFQLNLRLGICESENETQMLNSLMEGLELDLEQAIVHVFERFVEFLSSNNEDDGQSNEEMLFARFIEFNRRYSHQMAKISGKLEQLLIGSGENLKMIFETCIRYF